MHVMHVVGARPNFMKAAPVVDALKRRPSIVQTIVHTGQHYDANMSDVFFDQLQLPRPDVSLNVGSATHAVQTAKIMIAFEQTLLERRPDLVLVYGDVNSTVAATLVSTKLGVLVGHVEAGLRSFDRSMPEELNRLVTDQLAELLFTPSADGDENLWREGIPEERIHRVGNVMIDTVRKLLPKAVAPAIDGLDEPYALVTLHRPSNVDNREILTRLIQALCDISKRCRIVWPLHPRTRNRLQQFGIALPKNDPNLVILEPLGYLECLALQAQATMVLTDSGGLQEETTYLGVPCLTLRENTERPITVDVGTNTLVGNDVRLLKREVEKILAGESRAGRVPDLWDGAAGERIAAVIDALSVGARSRAAA
ncbi:MAG: UDP-N-acetylglucosamine 2-epimerase (non-hydrolyzing) [Planctomycetes bacterium]|nr:UDP-N-acetylglucosamine 2-epimerase (non-hydrolyzing) [Planctomycetota bacterium]